MAFELKLHTLAQKAVGVVRLVMKKHKLRFHRIPLILIIKKAREKREM